MERILSSSVMILVLRISTEDTGNQKELHGNSSDKK